MSIYQTIKELRDNGKPVDAWNAGYSTLQNEPNNLYLKRSLYWACYKGIKAIQEQISRRDNKAPTRQEQEDIGSWLSCIEQLSLPVPCEELDYRFFNLFKENGWHYENFIRFVLNNHTTIFLWPDDYTPYQGGKYESLSQVVKQARMAAKGWLAHRKEWDISFSDLRSFLDMADKKAKDQDKTWLHYDYAKCLIAAKEYDVARNWVLPVVHKKTSEFWAWGALAATYVKHDLSKAITCYSKGLSECREDKFSGEMRRGLAILLAKQEKYNEASALLCSIADIYRVEGWKLKPEYEEMMAQPWFNAATAESVDINHYLVKAGTQANDLLYDEIKTETGVVTKIHRSEKGCEVYLSQNHKVQIRKGLFATKKLPSTGDWVKVRCAKASGKTEALEAKLTAPVQIAGVEMETGELRVNPKGFAFVGDTYVPPSLIKSDWNGDEVEILKVWDKHPAPNKNKMAWKAISIERKKSMVPAVIS